jgi:hypothetical protein
MSETGCARPHAEIIEELIDSRIPKGEYGHAARREIINLRSRLNDCQTNILIILDSCVIPEDKKELCKRIKNDMMRD